MHQIEQHKSEHKHDPIPKWLEWAREIQALAQTGSYYSTDEYNRQRYQRLLDIAAEIVSDYSKLDLSTVSELFHQPVGYATPRIDVRGAVFRDRKILLVKEKMDGHWTMPGGWADVGDIPSGATEREVWEESGFRVRSTRVIGVYDANRSGPLELFHAFKVVFLCEIISGVAMPSDETLEVAFFELNQVPADLSGERTRIRHIHDAYQCLDQPNYPTVFD